MNATYLFSVGPALRPGRVRHLVAAPRRWAPWAPGRSERPSLVVTVELEVEHWAALVAALVAGPDHGEGMRARAAAHRARAMARRPWAVAQKPRAGGSGT